MTASRQLHAGTPEQLDGQPHISRTRASIVLAIGVFAIGTPLHAYPLRSWGAMIGLALVTQVVGHLSVATSSIGHRALARSNRSRCSNDRTRTDAH